MHPHPTISPCQPPATNADGAMAVMPSAGCEVGTLTFQVLEPLAGLVERNLFSRVHHPFALNLAIKISAFELVLFGQTPAFLSLRSLLGRFSKEGLQSFSHCLVEFNFLNVSAFLADSRELVQSLRRRGVNNFGTHTRFIGVGHFAACHALVGHCASWLSVG